MPPARGIRNHNPGNIDFNQAQFDRDKWVGEVGLEDHRNPRFTTFSEPVFGIRAMAKILLTYYRLRKADDGSAIDTVQEIIDRWAPPSENNTDAYATHVRKALGVEPGEILDVSDPDILADLCALIISHENGQQPYTPQMIHDGVRLALV